MSGNARLHSAIEELKHAGANNLPSTSMVNLAAVGRHWKGTTNNGTGWQLTKSNNHSFTVTLEYGN